MSDRDPPRLSTSGDASALLKDALRESKADLPDEARLAAIALKLGPIVGGAAGGGAAAAASGGAAAKASVAPAAAKLGAASLSMKIAAAVAVTAVAVGGTAVVAPKIMAPKTAVTVAAPSSPITMPARTANDPSTFDLALPPASASAAPLPVPSAKPSTTPPADAPTEVALLARAQSILATDPAAALATCSDRARLYPRGSLAQECEVVSIDALVREGKTAEAKARADKFQTDYAGSAHIPRVKQIVGEP